MTSPTPSITPDLRRFGEVVAASGDWTAASPCEGWTAADVVAHVVDTQREFLTARGADLERRPQGSPEEVWRAHAVVVEPLLEDDDFLERPYESVFGPSTVGAVLAAFYGFDLLVHRWDLGTALGHPVTWDEDEMDRIEKAAAGFGDALHSDGVCGPEVPVPADAPRQQRLLGMLGRRG